MKGGDGHNPRRAIDLGEARVAIDFWDFGTAIQTYLEDFYAQLDQAERLNDWRFLSEKHPTLSTDKKQNSSTYYKSGIPATDKIFPWVVEISPKLKLLN